MLRWVPIFLLVCLCLPSLAGPNIARYAATRASSDAGWDDPYSAYRVLWFCMDSTNALGQWTDSGSTNLGTASGPTRTIGGTNTVATDLHFGRTEIVYSWDGVDDTATVNKSSDFDLTADHSAMCWCAWIYPLSVGEGGSGRVMDKAAGATGWLFYLTATAKFNAAWAASSSLSTGNGALAFTNWNHVAVVRGNFGLGGAGIHDLGIWINGVNVTNLADSLYNADVNSVLTIGQGSGQTGRTFDGLIDDVRIYTNPPFALQTNLTAVTTFLGTLVTETQKPNASNENGY